MNTSDNVKITHENCTDYQWDTLIQGPILCTMNLYFLRTWQSYVTFCWSLLLDVKQNSTLQPSAPHTPCIYKFNNTPQMSNVGRSVNYHLVGLSFYTFLSKCGFWGKTVHHWVSQLVGQGVRLFQVQLLVWHNRVSKQTMTNDYLFLHVFLQDQYHVLLLCAYKLYVYGGQRMFLHTFLWMSLTRTKFLVIIRS